MNVVITGITGFAGSHLTEYLVRNRHHVRGLGAPHHNLLNLNPIIASGELNPDDVLLADIEDNNALKRLLHPPPDILYHLAAQASVPYAWKHPKQTFRINVMGTLTLLDCLRELKPCPRTLFVSSADVYGASANDIPGLLGENTPLQPTNPYSLSKAAADGLCQQAFQSDGLPIIRVRPFNHIGPRQAQGFAAADFAHQIARCETTNDTATIQVGRLDAIRDFSDVRDMVRAYQLAVTKGEPGAVYNICSGVGRTLQELLDGLLALSPNEFHIVHDPEKIRPVEIPCFVGSNKLFAETTGWKPQIPWSKTLKDILNDHRQSANRQTGA
jgi:GDP-4-dehydro-6-deoxy-D-mannose reductase